MNTYGLLRQLAKTNKFQNLFSMCKELHGFRMFTNDREFSQLQDIFLYMYFSINQDISVDKISPHVLDSELYTDSYLLWRNQGKKRELNDKKSDVHLIASDTIIFPKKKEEK